MILREFGRIVLLYQFLTNGPMSVLLLPTVPFSLNGDVKQLLSHLISPTRTKPFVSEKNDQIFFFGANLFTSMASGSFYLTSSMLGLASFAT